MCFGSQEGKSHPGVHQSQNQQLVERVDSTLYLVLVQHHLDHGVQLTRLKVLAVKLMQSCCRYVL